MASNKKGGMFCSAYGCTKNWKQNPELSFFRFPSDRERCRRWVANCKRKDLDSLDVVYLNQNSRMCSQHFESSQFMNATSRDSLVWNAVPTVFSLVPNSPSAAAAAASMGTKRPALENRELLQHKEKVRKNITSGNKADLNTDEPVDDDVAGVKAKTEVKEEWMDCEMDPSKTGDWRRMMMESSQSREDWREVEGESVSCEVEPTTVIGEVKEESIVPELDPLETGEENQESSGCELEPSQSEKVWVELEEKPNQCELECSQTAVWGEVEQDSVSRELEPLQEEEEEGGVGDWRGQELQPHFLLDLQYPKEPLSVSDQHVRKDDSEVDRTALLLHRADKDQGSSGEGSFSDSEDSCSDDSLSDYSDSSEESSADEVETGNWKSISDVLGDRRPDPKPSFDDDTSGLNTVMDTDKTPPEPKDVFTLLFDPNLISHMCRWTNGKADDYLHKKGPGCRKVNGLLWRAVTVNDMYTFISLIILMGITHLPQISLYWSKNRLVYGTPAVFCKEVMSRDRFLTILKFLRFSPLVAVKKMDPRTHLEPYLDLLRDRCQALVTPGKHVAVDETLMVWKRRLEFREFVKLTRTKCELKVFCLCPADKTFNGYTWNFQVHCGKDNFEMGDPNVQNLKVPEKILIYLLKDLLDGGRHVITGKWATSYRLAAYLETRNTLLTGVMKSGRGSPKEFQKEKLEKNRCSFIRRGNALMVKWQGRKEVYLLTTKYEANTAEDNQLHIGEATSLPSRQSHILKYHEKMGSVEYADRMLAPYDNKRRSLSWLKKVGIHFIFRMLLNAFVLHNAAHPYHGDFLHFVTETARGLLIQHNEGAAKLAEEISKPEKVRLGDIHIPLKVHQFIRSTKRRRCRVCYRLGQRKETHYHCPGCPTSPALCSMEHYQVWHAQEPQSNPGGEEYHRGRPLQSIIQIEQTENKRRCEPTPAESEEPVSGPSGGGMDGNDTVTTQLMTEEEMRIAKKLVVFEALGRRKELVVFEKKKMKKC